MENTKIVGGPVAVKLEDGDGGPELFCPRTKGVIQETTTSRNKKHRTFAQAGYPKLLEDWEFFIGSVHGGKLEDPQRLEIWRTFLFAYTGGFNTGTHLMATRDYLEMSQIRHSLQNEMAVLLKEHKEWQPPETK